MTDLVARLGPSGRKGRRLVAVEADGRQIGWVEVSGHRHLVETGSRTGGQAPPPRADPAAWTADAARRAAGDRWREHHRAVRTVRRIEVDEAVSAAAVIETAGDGLAGRGVRRLDLRVRADDPVAPTLVGPRWVQGRIGGDIVASLAIAYPWTDAPDPTSRLAAVLRPLPPRLRRLVRRVAAVHPRQIPELARSVGTEAAAVARHRSSPTSRTLPVAGAPPGSHPFAASRYRTVRAALALVPDPLRSTLFVDIGCGDGRVLREALDAGFGRVYGRELDADLAEQARALIGDGGRVDVGDALAAPLPDEIGVVFLNNPFDSPLLEQFARLLSDSLGRRPRPLLVLYLNPRPIEPLLDAGLMLVHVEPRFSVFATQAPV